MTEPTCPGPRYYVETRLTADTTKPGSRWERVGRSDDERTSRAVLDAITGLDKRLVRLDWDPDGDEDSLPTTTVVEEFVRQ